MSASPLLARWTRRARARGAADAVLLGAPAVALAVAAAWRGGALPAATETAAAALAALAVIAVAHARRFDAAWLTRRLDSQLPGLEDSADLLAADRAALPPLRRLQRDRVEARLAAGAAPELAPARPTRAILLAAAVGLAAVAAVLAWPRGSGLTAVSEGAAMASPGAPRLVAARLRVTPPAYTGLPARDLPGLDAQVPQGSRLEWTLRFAPSPTAAKLAGADGALLPLVRGGGGDWTGVLVLDRSRLYRVAPRGPAALPAAPLHRLDAVPDAPPQVRVVEPAQTLTLVTDGRRAWRLVFEATDDYGAAPDARLKLTLADGAGEQVTFHERELTLHGAGPARRRRFTATLDPAAQGLKPGGDLVAQLFVSDTRAPAPQTAASPSLILRWPVAPEAAGEGMEGAVKTVLPAYLRSERQIIIDAQALLKARPGLGPDRFLARSDALGADQQSLRLRYGQFLGGENEHAENTMPTSDDDDAKPAKAPEAAPAPAPAFGVEGNVTRTYGHAHDETESSALEPSVRDKLKLSVDQMWAAETHLRQGDPAGALPYAEKALAFLKEAQRAERVFVPRTGLQTPPIDETRRLTGKRDGLARDPLELGAAPTPDPVRLAAWRALADAPDGPLPPAALEAVARWSRAGASGADPLALAAALDAVRREPGCTRCRRTLRGLAWAALPRPPPHVAARASPDAQGRRYLQALAGGGGP